MSNKGTACIFIGYTTHHAGDCYRMWNPETRKVHTTRDVLWLHRMYFRRPATRPDIVVDPDSPSEVGESDANENENENANADESFTDADFLPNAIEEFDKHDDNSNSDDRSDGSSETSEASSDTDIIGHSSRGRPLK